MTANPPPSEDELRRFLADRKVRVLAWALFQKNGRRAAERMIRRTEDSRTS